MIKKASNSVLKRKIVDYKKLTPEILTMLVEKYPDGYGDDDIITFKNIRNETIEAVELRTHECIFLVKVSTKLVSQMERFGLNDDDPNSIGGTTSIPIVSEEE